MAYYITTQYQSVTDICIITYGNMDYINKLCLDNNLKIEDEIPVGTKIVYDDNIYANPNRITTGEGLYDTIRIIVEPEDYTACILYGDAIANFSVIADGNVTTYQWYRSLTPDGPWTILIDDYEYSGTTTPYMTFNATLYNGQVFYYKCKIGANTFTRVAKLIVSYGVSIDDFVQNLNNDFYFYYQGNYINREWSYLYPYNDIIPLIGTGPDIVGPFYGSTFSNYLTATLSARASDNHWRWNNFGIGLKLTTPYCGSTPQYAAIFNTVEVPQIPPVGTLSNYYNILVGGDFTAWPGLTNAQVLSTQPDRAVPTASFAWQPTGIFGSGTPRMEYIGRGDFKPFLYFGCATQSLDAIEGFGYDTSLSEYDIKHHMENYASKNLGTHSQMSIGLLFKINSNYQQPGFISGTMCMYAFRSDYLTGTASQRGCRVCFNYNDSTDDYNVFVENGGNVGTNQFFFNNVKADKVYALAATLDKSDPSQQIQAELMDWNYVNYTGTMSGNYINSGFFQNNLFSPIIGHVGSNTFGFNDPADCSLGSAILYKGAWDKYQRQLVQYWMLKTYSL